MVDYAPYFVRAIKAHATGFKPVPGGTGNGKTSALPTVIAAGITDRKYIYVENRLRRCKSI